MTDEEALICVGLSIAVVLSLVLGIAGIVGAISRYLDKKEADRE